MLLVGFRVVTVVQQCLGLGLPILFSVRDHFFVTVFCFMMSGHWNCLVLVCGLTPDAELE